MANLKIHDLHATDSEMHELADEELKNIVGGCYNCKDWKKMGQAYTNVSHVDLKSL
ncbi:MAG: hypothetical protein RLZZ381_923 [Cyanobacteriota bacterium]|jgi:bacteriocin-like protein